MEIALNSFELIHLYLKTFIHDPYIRNIIINYKYKSELQDDLRYHINQWDIIASAYYYTKDNQHHYSLVFTDNNRRGGDYLSRIFFSSNKPPQYIIRPDHIKDFYNISHFSYQTRELILELIHTRHTCGLKSMITDDILYSTLSHKINSALKHISHPLKEISPPT